MGDAPTRTTVIAVANYHPTARDGGSATYVRAWGRAAIRAGYEPHIFCANFASRTESTPFGVVHSGKSAPLPIRTMHVEIHGRYIARAIEAFAAARGGRCLIHSFGSWGGVGVAAARRLEQRCIDCVTVVTPFTTCNHEMRGKLRWDRLRSRLMVEPSERRGLRRSDLVLVNYDSVRAIVAAELGDGIRFHRAAYAAEAAFLHDGAARTPAPEAIARLEPKDAPLIVAVSRQDPRKGLDVLLNALALLRAGGVRFRACLVGAGALLADHRALATKLDLLACTSLPGRVPDAFAYHQHADIFALPSLEEGSGSVSLLEAMQAGAAPVVSRVDGLPEDVSDGESGLLVTPGSADELARALRRLIEDAALRTRLAAGAHAFYRAHFTADAFAADLGKAYASLGFPAAAPLERARPAFASASVAR